MIVMASLLFSLLLITVQQIYLRCLLTQELGEKNVPFVRHHWRQKVFQNTLKSGSGGRPPYLQIINSRKCEVCHAKKQGAI